jgi:2'-5' RNA ligase
MLYAITIILPEPIRSNLIEIQKRFKHPNWNITLPPHITIVPPFSLSKNSTSKDIIVAVKNSVKTLSQFNVETKGIRKFDNKVSTIYLFVLLSPNLTELHSKINATMSPIINEILDYPKDYIPHVTLSSDIPTALSDEYYSKMRDLNLGGTFRCTKVTLLKESPEDKNWIPVEDSFLK